MPVTRQCDVTGKRNPRNICRLLERRNGGEILYVIPRRTACYECFARFRRTEEPNDKVDARKYTDPDFDETKRPPEAGLWANILIVCGFAFHVALSLLGASKLARLVLEDATPLFFVNVAEQDSSLPFWSVSKAGVARPCGVCGDFPGLQG